MSSNITYGVSTKPIEVPQALQDGEKFIKWDEGQESGGGVPVTLRVDPKGFFLYWTDQNMEVELLDIATIRDVRTGQYAKVPKDPKLRCVVTMGSATAGSLEDKTITVCSGLNFVDVNFVNFCGAKKETAQMWTEALFTLAYNIYTSNLSALRVLEKLHTRIWLRADKNNNIPVRSIVRQLATHKDDRRRVEKALGEAGLPAAKNESVPRHKLQFEDFFHFYKCLTKRTEVHDIFMQLTEGKPTLSAAGLMDFLNGTQRDPRLNEILHPYADLARAADLIRQHEPNKYHVQRQQMSADGFLRFLMSSEAGAVAPIKLELCDDMEQPLAHYFINSSHNTYLTGHQITGRSSVEMYRQALLAGCRCVELDFWNGRTEEPVIVHGYTFVPEISAREVLEAIAESAFKTSEFPVILSFENHCNARQQAKIAQYCREIFGDMLLDRPLDSHPLVPGGELPSPYALRRKIIIKNKKKHHHHHKREEPVPEEAAAEDEAAAGVDDTAAGDNVPSEPQADVPTGNGDVNTVLGKCAVVRQASSSSSSSGSEDEAEAESGAAPTPAAGLAAAAAAANNESHAGAEISALVNYVQPVHFTSFENAEKKNRFYEMSSFDEKQAMGLLKEAPVEFVRYNKTQLSRVYPVGTRFDSTNFHPQVYWNAGCQLVALNYQNLDQPMQLNIGAFEYNRRSGYLLKPEFMRRKDRRLDPFAESTVDGIVAGSVSVSVLSGQLLGERRAYTHVEVDLLGLPADTQRKRHRTRPVQNSINPTYGDEPFVFKKVVLPGLAWLRLAAVEEGGKLLGARVLPLASLRPGLRHVTLRGEAGAPATATLLLRITVADYVPDQMAELAEALANPIKYQSELDKREQQLSALLDDADTQPQLTKQLTEELSLPAPAHKSSRSICSEAGGPECGGGGSCDEGASPGRAGGGVASAAADAGEASEEEEVARLLQCRAARHKRAELARKLDALKKKTKPKFYTHKLVKRLSVKNIGGSAAESEAGGGAAGAGEAASLEEAERELRLRYHAAVHAALARHADNHTHAQCKRLALQLDHDKKEVLSRLAAARKEDVKALVRSAARDKDEVTRMKRELHAASVARGVAECSRLEADYAARRERLARRHDRLRQALARHRDQELAELEQMFGGGGGGDG